MVSYLQQLLIHLGWRLSTILFDFISLYPQKYRTRLPCTTYSTIKVKSLSYMIFWQTMTQGIFRYMQAENTSKNN